jgi:hypothetical protein
LQSTQHTSLPIYVGRGFDGQLCHKTLSARNHFQMVPRSEVRRVVIRPKKDGAPFLLLRIPVARRVCPKLISNGCILNQLSKDLSPTRPLGTARQTIEVGQFNRVAGGRRRNRLEAGSAVATGSSPPANF